MLIVLCDSWHESVPGRVIILCDNWHESAPGRVIILCDSGYKSKPGRDIPSWWTPYREENLIKSDAANWGNHETEVRHPTLMQGRWLMGRGTDIGEKHNFMFRNMENKTHLIFVLSKSSCTAIIVRSLHMDGDLHRKRGI